MIQVEKISKQFGPQLLFEDVSFVINPGEKIGLVGRNGSGKSTIFKILTGQILPDEGKIRIPSHYRIGTLDQHLVFSKESVLAECVASLPEAQKHDHYLAEKILFGLGFDDKDLVENPVSFSGGQQIRIQLAKVLLTNPQLLLLDEPTNYLDILALRWLKRFLNQFPGELILITHDRSFMDEVISHTMGLSHKGLKKLAGKTEQYYMNIAEEQEMLAKTHQNIEKKRQHLQSFVDRFRAKASKARQAQSRMKQLEKIESFTELPMESDFGFSFHYKDCPGKILVNIENLSFSYNPQELKNYLFQNLNLNIGKHDRIAIIGKNGRGKSTLLNVLAGELTPSDGAIKEHPLCVRGHYGQTNVLRLHLENTIVQEIQESNAELSMTQVRQIAGCMMFEGELADKKIKVLSGGERGRVLLGKILAKPSNLLLLDEPTNHLDMEAVEVLTEQIKRFPGAILMVTHNEQLLREVAESLIVFKQSGVDYFRGGYDEFLEKVGWEDEAESFTETRDKKNQNNIENKLSYKEQKAKRAQLIMERSRLCTPFKKQIDDLERLIVNNEEKVKLLTAELEIATLNKKDQVLLAISREIGELENEIEIQFNELTEVSNQYEEIYNSFEEKLELLKSL